MADGFQSREIDPKPISGNNATGSTIPKGTIVTPTAVAPDGITPSTTADEPYLGVSGEDIADGEYGRVVGSGVALVLAGATVTVGGRVTSNAAGRAIDWSATESVLGVAKEAGADGVLIEVQLSGPGGQH